MLFPLLFLLLPHSEKNQILVTALHIEQSGKVDVSRLRGRGRERELGGRTGGGRESVRMRTYEKESERAREKVVGRGEGGEGESA
jgi:hypothetical protein